MSPIKEMPPITPWSHLVSGSALGLISHARLPTRSKTKVNRSHGDGATFGLVTGESVHAGGHDTVPTETRATFR